MSSSSTSARRTQATESVCQCRNYNPVSDRQLNCINCGGVRPLALSSHPPAPYNLRNQASSSGEVGMEDIKEGRNAHPTRTVEPRLICFYAEKGGVGKTTQSCTIAWTLAMKGHKVLIYDCDAQRSLSAWLLGEYIEADPFFGMYNDYVFRRDLPGDDNNRPRTLFQQLEPVRTANADVTPAYAIEVPHCKNLWIVPGDRLISDYDGYVAAADALMGYVPTQANLHGAPYHAIMATARHIGVDYVIVDLNPSRGALNRCLVMSSHYVIVPAVADFFSYEMLSDFGTAMIGWRNTIERNNVQLRDLRTRELLGNPAAPNSIKLPFPQHFPKLLGYILSRYKIKPGTALGTVQPNGLANDQLGANEGHWASRVETSMCQVSATLVARQLVVPSPGANPGVFGPPRGRALCLGRVSEFHQLGALSGTFHTPVPFLRAEHMVTMKNQQGDAEQMKNWEEKLENVDRFRRICAAAVDNILLLVASSPPGISFPAGN